MKKPRKSRKSEKLQIQKARLGALKASIFEYIKGRLDFLLFSFLTCDKKKVGKSGQVNHDLAVFSK